MAAAIQSRGQAISVQRMTRAMTENLKAKYSLSAAPIGAR